VISSSQRPLPDNTRHSHQTNIHAPGGIRTHDLSRRAALPPLLFNFALDYAVRRVHVNQNSLKLNVTHQLLVYVDDINIVGGSVHAVKENAEALIVASKEI